MEKNVAVSVICNAYNHETYIAQCLESLVMQKTNFPYEILVHDDASTDRTADIIREYEKQYPHLVKPIYQTENQYSKGGIDQFQYPRAKGRYIAFCEGDDYWTDPLKLQKQFDAMEAHPEVDMCTHAAVMIDGRTEKKIGTITPKQADCIIPVEDVIAGDGSYVASNSWFYRAELDKTIPPFRQLLDFDYTFQIDGALRGGLLYLSDYMSVYRIMAKGSWSTTMKSNPEKMRAHREKVREAMLQLDIDTAGAYHEAVEYSILSMEFENLNDNGCYKELLDPRFKACYQMLPKRRQINIRLKASLPILCVINEKLQEWKLSFQSRKIQ